MKLAFLTLAFLVSLVFTPLGSAGGTCNDIVDTFCVFQDADGDIRECAVFVGIDQGTFTCVPSGGLCHHAPSHCRDLDNLIQIRP